MLFTACASDERPTTAPAEPPVSADFDFGSLLANYADNILIPSYSQMQNEVTALAQTANTFCAAPGDATAFPEAVRIAWTNTMAAWQQVELMRVGPLLESGSLLRNRIHAFNVENVNFNTCAVDQNVALAAQQSDFNIVSRSFSGRGLWALEYLYFDQSLTQSCPDQVVATQGWNDLPAAERLQERCNFAALALGDVQAAVDQLVTEWSDEGGDYRSIFINPFNAGTQMEALFDALFFVEKESKDAKLGVPLAFKTMDIFQEACNQIACPDQLESPFSQTTKTNIENNIVAFQQMMRGGDGLGFDDLLKDVGAEYLVGEFDTLIEEALTLLRNEDESFYTELLALQQGGDVEVCVNAQANASVSDGPTACRVHGILKQITDRLRMEFSVAIDIDLPDRVGGDGD